MYDVYTHIHGKTYMYTDIHTYSDIYVYVNIYIYIHTYIQYIHIHIRTCACMYAWMHAWMYVSMYVQSLPLSLSPSLLFPCVYTHINRRFVCAYNRVSQTVRHGTARYSKA